MRKIRSISTNRFDGQPCMCPGCVWARRENARRQAQGIAIACALGFAGAFAAFFMAEGALAVIAGAGAFALLFLGFLAALES